MAQPMPHMHQGASTRRNIRAGLAGPLPRSTNNQRLQGFVDRPPQQVGGTVIHATPCVPEGELRQRSRVITPVIVRTSLEQFCAIGHPRLFIAFIGRAHRNFIAFESKDGDSILLKKTMEIGFFQRKRIQGRETPVSLNQTAGCWLDASTAAGPRSGSRTMNRVSPGFDST